MYNTFESAGLSVAAVLIFALGMLFDRWVHRRRRGNVTLRECDETALALTPPIAGVIPVLQQMAYVQVIGQLKELEGMEEWYDERADLQHIQSVLRSQMQLDWAMEARTCEEDGS